MTTKEVLTSETVLLADDHFLQTLPRDELFIKFINNVRPLDWQNPTPAEKYNLLVIGGGSGGLLAAAGASMMGAKVALVEKNIMGGDCLNTGCVPSKAIIRSARAMYDVATAHEFGVSVPEGVTLDFEKAMRRVRQVRADISYVDSVKRFTDLGVDVFLGSGKFTGRNSFEVDGKTIHFKKAVIATGSRAYHPPIEGLSEAGYLTNETVFNLTEQPKSMAIIGAGPIGCELAQTFSRFGTKVTIIQDSPHILNREDADAAEIVQEAFIKEGIGLVFNAKTTHITVDETGKTLLVENSDGTQTIIVDEILVATGRLPNVQGLGLEIAGVDYTERRGVIVNKYLQTSNPVIYATGDVTLAHKFTHTADAASRIVLRNALFAGSMKHTDMVIPWCTYTDPEIAHVGMYEATAKAQGIEVDTFTAHFDHNDRAIADGDQNGFVKVHVKKGSDKILGATIVARTAGDMINEFTLAIMGKLGLGTIAKTIHPYPTQGEGIKKVADMYNASRLTPTAKKFSTKWLDWTL
ncbi:mercuric reductase [Anaerolineales bacterium HSG6]|nr:mercuric reductase [Anaerolineales bacterium HSG6]